MKTTSYLFIIFLVSICFHARAQQIANADTVTNLSDTGFIKQSTLGNLTRLVDSTRHGYHGAIVIAVDKLYQPVDSVYIVSVPDSIYDPFVRAEQLTKYKKVCMTGLSGFARAGSINSSSPGLFGYKGKIVYQLREDSYVADHDDMLYIMRPHYDKPAAAKKGIKLNLHNQPQKQ